MKNKAVSYVLICLLLAIIWLDFSYPVTLTFDSGHYLMLANLIEKAQWHNWDPIRGIIFPLFLLLLNKLVKIRYFLSLIPLVTCHLLSLCFAGMIVKQLVGTNKKDLRQMFLIWGSFFIFVVLDPIIIGYYHTLLTEFIASTLSLFVCWSICYILDNPKKRFTISWGLVFIILSLLAWHLKQPYIGAIYFPYVAFMIILSKRKQWNLVLRSSLLGVLSLSLVLASNSIWYEFLRINGAQIDTSRNISKVISSSVETNLNFAKNDFFSFVEMITKRYLAITNFLLFDQSSYQVIGPASFVRGSENEVIAYRMFNDIGSGNYLPHEPYQGYSEPFFSKYKPPIWINKLLVSFEKKSNFMFTITGLLSPLLAILLIIKNTGIHHKYFILIFSVFSNNLFHAIFVAPIDRYAFWGYILSLCVICAFFVRAITSIVKMKKKEQ